MLSRASGTHGRGGCSSRVNYVKSRIREAAAQAHTESPPAACLLRASFAVSKAEVGA